MKLKLIAATISALLSITHPCITVNAAAEPVPQSKLSSLERVITYSLQSRYAYVYCSATSSVALDKQPEVFITVDISDPLSDSSVSVGTIHTTCRRYLNIPADHIIVTLNQLS